MGVNFIGNPYNEEYESDDEVNFVLDNFQEEEFFAEAYEANEAADTDQVVQVIGGVSYFDTDASSLEDTEDEDYVDDDMVEEYDSDAESDDSFDASCEFLGDTSSSTKFSETDSD